MSKIFKALAKEVGRTAKSDARTVRLGNLMMLAGIIYCLISR